MKHFKNENEKPYSYEDNVKDEQMAEGLTPITEAEFNEITNPPLTAEELDTQAERDRKMNGEDYDLNGTLYKVPFTSEDANGLMQVNVAFTMGVTNTNIHLSNGTIMPIAVADFAAFALWFVTKRNSFFL